MAKGRWCSEEKRALVLQMKAKGRKVAEISQLLEYSRKMVHNAINHMGSQKM